MLATNAIDLEYGNPGQIEAHQLERLKVLLTFLKNDSQNKFYQAKLAGIDLDDIGLKSDLARLPFTTKAELVAEQTLYPPYGRNLSYPEEAYIKLHQTSGTTGRPLKVLDTVASWNWWAQCWERVYRAAGVTATDRVFMAFSFGPFIGFWAAYEGAQLVGALALPGGGMDTEQRIAAILESQATVLCCTPTYALHMADVAAQKAIDLAASSVRVAIHAGEPGAGISSVRRQIERAWGATCFDHAGGSEVGAYGYSCVTRNGLHVNEAEFIAEVIDPNSGQPVAPGQSGELVITNLGRWGYPVIRYRTGDAVKLAAKPCECGRSFVTLEGGITGRIDDMLIVRGINIYPSAVEAIIREIFELNEFRIKLFRENDLDEMAIELEMAESQLEKLETLKSLLRQRLALRVPVQAVPVGSLPRFQLKARRVIDKR